MTALPKQFDMTGLQEEEYPTRIVLLTQALAIACQALEAIQFGSLEANFKQCTQTHQEIADDAIRRITELGGGKA